MGRSVTDSIMGAARLIRAVGIYVVSTTTVHLVELGLRAIDARESGNAKPRSQPGNVQNELGFEVE